MMPPRLTGAVVVALCILSGVVWFSSKDEITSQAQMPQAASGPSASATTAISAPAIPELTPKAQPNPITFNGQVAAILHRHCAICHRPGGAGPFSLLTYVDARQRASLIAAVTASRYMPPWQPARGKGVFAHARRLSDADIAALRTWAVQGAPQGLSSPEPEAPRFAQGWQLGPPDLVVHSDSPYLLKADGVDQFRNFVLPLPVKQPRYVKALEFRPGNPRVVHHAVLQVDRSHASRRRDAAEPGAGFGGMDMGAAENPGGQFIGWTPGKLTTADERLAWRLDPGSDLVVQLHMLPSGKQESVSMEVGLYFSSSPPTLHPVSLVLRNNAIDIPAGDNDYVVEDDLVLPVPVKAIGIYPHAHYLGKSVKVWAELPDGTSKQLIHIPAWDFNWQDDYRYASPLDLPAGAHVRMRYTYDNSAANIRNPHNPPRRVRFGNRSSDEMATLTIQVLPQNETDRWRLSEASMRKRLQRSPDSWFLHTALGAALNELSRHDEAELHFRQAMKLDPNNPAPVYNLANALLARQNFATAAQVYRDVLRLDPEHPKVRNNLAVAYRYLSHLDLATEQLMAQIELSPKDARVRYNLGAALLDNHELERAAKHLRLATELDDKLLPAREDLGEVLRRLRRQQASRQQLRAALELDPRSKPARFSLGLLSVSHGDREDGLAKLRQLLQEDDEYLGRLNNEAWSLATKPGDTSQAGAAQALAELLVKSVPEAIPELLDTLAAAYAANGQYAQAVATIDRAIELARTGAKAAYLPEFNARRARYAAGQRYER